MALPPPPPGKAPPPLPKKLAPVVSSSAGLGSKDEDDAVAAPAPPAAKAPPPAAVPAPTVKAPPPLPGKLAPTSSAGLGNKAAPEAASAPPAAPAAKAPPPAAVPAPTVKAPPPPAGAPPPPPGKAPPPPPGKKAPVASSAPSPPAPEKKAPPPPAPEKKAPPPPAKAPPPAAPEKKAPPPPAPEAKKAPPPPAPEAKKAPPPPAPEPKSVPAPAAPDAAKAPSPSTAAPEETKPVAAPAASAPAPAAAAASPLSPEAISWMRRMTLVAECGKMEASHDQSRSALIVEEREAALFMLLSEQAKRSVLKEKQALLQQHLTTKRKELEALERLEREARALLDTEEAAMRSTVTLPFYCSLQIGQASKQQQQRVDSALKQIHALSETHMKNSAERERMLKVSERLEGIESTLQTSLATVAADPSDTYYYKTRAIVRSELQDRDFLEDLQLSLRREIIELCHSAILSPVLSRTGSRVYSPTREASMLQLEYTGGSSSSMMSPVRYVDPHASVAALQQQESAMLPSPPKEAAEKPSSPSNVGGDRWLPLLKDILSTEMTFSSSQVNRYAAMFEENGFLACVDGTTDAIRAKESLLSVLGEVTSDDLKQMGISTVGERRAIISQLKKHMFSQNDRSTSAASSVAVPPSTTMASHSSPVVAQKSSSPSAVQPISLRGQQLSASSTAAAVIGGGAGSPGGVAQNTPPRQLSGSLNYSASPLSSPSASYVATADPVQCFSDEVCASGSADTAMEVYVDAVRKKLRVTDSQFQREWEKLRRQAFSPTSRRREQSSALERRDGEWEQQWRTACIADLSSEAEWERRTNQLKDRISAGLSVGPQDLPSTPCQGDQSTRQKVIKLRASGL